MKKLFIILIVAGFLCAGPATAHILEDIWDKYADMAENTQQVQLDCPGKVIGKKIGSGNASFEHNWEFRAKTYELHFDDSSILARSIYSLALFSGDISSELPKEKFYSGVLGFHYSIKQVCAWLNHTFTQRKTLLKNENILVGYLLSDNVLKIDNGIFVSTGAVDHILGAAPGKKRGFEQNIRHERMHVFWDKHPTFKAEFKKKWATMTEVDKNTVRKSLKNYNEHNEDQIIEEWAVKSAEKNRNWLK